MATWPMVRAWAERRAEFTYGDRRCVAIQLNTGRVEVYAVDPTGLEMFRGYADDGTLGAPVVVAALGALAKAGRTASVSSQVLAVAQ